MYLKLSAFRSEAMAFCAKFDVRVALWVMLAMMLVLAMMLAMMALTACFRVALESSGQAVGMYMSWRRQ